MTKEEVIAVAGSPSHRENGDKIWAYWTYESGIMAPFQPVYVSFDQDGRVAHIWN